MPSKTASQGLQISVKCLFSTQVFLSSFQKRWLGIPFCILSEAWSGEDGDPAQSVRTATAEESQGKQNS